MVKKWLDEKAQLQEKIDVALAKATTDNLTIQYLSSLLIQMNGDLAASQHQLALILGSFRWRLASVCVDILGRIKLKTFTKHIFQKLKKTVDKKDHFIENEQLTNQPANKSVVKLSPKLQPPVVYNIYPYKNLQLLKDIEVIVVEEDFSPGYYQVQFSIVTPVWNEAAGIIDFLKSIQAQTLQPDEVILTDGGSTDTTVQLIEAFALQANFTITVIKEKRIPIATGRNLAIKKARNEIIVMADAGTLLDKNYCLNLVSCFKKYRSPELVSGIWLPIQASEHTAAFIPDWSAMDWNKWLPSTRTMAIRKSLIKKAGYFPEHIFYGDDTLFDFKYRRISKKWVFNKNAITYWDAPVSKEQYDKTSRNYGKGDGENGLGEYFYPQSLLQAAKIDSPVQTSPVRKEFLEGYLEGWMNRGKIEVAIRKIRGVLIFLTTIPFYENEHSFIFKEIIKSLAKNYKVICVHFYPNLDTLVPKKYLDIDYTLLELYYVDDFNVNELLLRYPLKDTTIKVIPEDKNPRFNRLLTQFRAKKILITKSLN